MASPTLETTAQSALDQLQQKLSGTVIVPSDGIAYEAARLTWNLSVNQHPAVIVVAYHAGDVVEAVRFAREQGLGVAVQSTGHGVTRPADDNLLIITAQMQEVWVNPYRQSAWVGAGALWKHVLEQTQQFGLAPLLGSSPDVGVVGYTLGGGMGWLARKYGLSADSVNHFEVVTADGRLLNVSRDEHSDLFWGLRGGGGSFGVITGMEIRLYPVATIYGGNMFYPVEQAKAVYRFYREWIKTLPDEMTTSIITMNFPPFPEVPEPVRGKTFVMVRAAYVGDVREGEALLQPWFEQMPPLMNMMRAMPFSEVGTISNDPVDPVAAYSTGVWLNELSDDAIDTILDYAVPKNAPPTLIFAEVRQTGGAMARVSPDASAYSNRQAPHLLEMVGATPTQEAYEAVKAYVGQVKAALQPALSGGVYMNFMSGEEARQQVNKGFSPEAFQRLTLLKAKYDPDNVFRFGFNIPVVKTS